jgi:2-polyprenyl-6-methoxyphenol hydroxylase-like FAD-dependent oxidoreductase
LTLAIGLAQKGMKKITMFEKRHEIVPTIGRMTSVYLSYRAISAYASVGIDITTIKGSLPITGFHFINPKMKVEIPLPSPKEVIMYSIDRHMLY